MCADAVTDTPLVDLSLAPFLPVDETEPERDVSAIIGSKLLQGWAMLDETCSSASCSGGVPLMRDKKGQVRCMHARAHAVVNTRRSTASSVYK